MQDLIVILEYLKCRWITLLNLASLHQSSCMTLITGEYPYFELCEHSILYGHLYEINHW